MALETCSKCGGDGGIKGRCATCGGSGWVSLTPAPDARATRPPLIAYKGAPRTVGAFAFELKQDPIALLTQLQAAGLNKQQVEDRLTVRDKIAYLQYMSTLHIARRRSLRPELLAEMTRRVSERSQSGPNKYLSASREKKTGGS